MCLKTVARYSSERVSIVGKKTGRYLKTNMKFKFGDRVKIVRNYGSASAEWYVGKEGIVIGLSFDCAFPIRVFVKDYSDVPCKAEELQLIGKGGEQENMSIVRYELTKRQKANLSADAQALVERGVLANDLSLQDKSWVWRFFMEKFQSEMADVARQEIAEDDAEKEKEAKKAKASK